MATTSTTAANHNATPVLTGKLDVGTRVRTVRFVGTGRTVYTRGSGIGDGGVGNRFHEQSKTVPAYGTVTAVRPFGPAPVTALVTTITYLDGQSLEARHRADKLPARTTIVTESAFRAAQTRAAKGKAISS